MPPIHVILIGGENQPLAVGRELNFFYVIIAGSEQCRLAAGGGNGILAAGGRNGIKMVAAILLGVKHYAVAGKIERAIFPKLGEGIIELLAAAPE